MQTRVQSTREHSAMDAFSGVKLVLEETIHR